MFKRRLNRLRGKSQDEVDEPTTTTKNSSSSSGEEATSEGGSGEDAAITATESTTTTMSGSTPNTAGNNNNNGGEEAKPVSSASRAAAAVKRAWSRGGSAGADSGSGSGNGGGGGSNAANASLSGNHGNNKNSGNFQNNSNNAASVSSKVSRRVRKGGSNNKETASFSSSSSKEGLDLSQFDACVEACDALAANSGSTNAGGGAGGQAAEKEKKHALPKDCSVLVSPDGSLLFLPTFGGSTSASTTSTESSSSSSSSTPPSSTTATATTKTRNPVELRLPLQANPELFFPGEEYEAAVVVGSDLRPDGDLGENGFSARGWSATGASAAIRRASTTLQLTTQFVEELILAKKEGAARSCAALDHLRDDLVVVLDAGNVTSSNVTTSNYTAFSSPGGVAGGGGGGGAASAATPRRSSKPTGGLLGRKRGSESSSTLLNPANLPAIPAIDATDVVVAPSPSPKRGLGVGRSSATSPAAATATKASPLLCPGGTLHSAAVAMEHYFSVVAEKDAARYRNASSSASVAEAGSSMGGLVGSAGPNLDVMRHAGVLPSLRAATELTQGRCRRRESALLEAQGRVDAAQSRLDQALKQSQHSWAAVQDAESQVQYRMEEIMRQRSRERERRRLEELAQHQALQQQEAEAATAAAAAAGGGGTTPKTDQEIWELVSQIGDGVSFAPTGLPPPTLVHSHSNMSDSAGDDYKKKKKKDGDHDDDDDHDEEPETSVPRSASSLETEAADSAPATPKSNASSKNIDEHLSEPSSPITMPPPPPPLPFASRPEIEQELGLPLLRATALAADDAVEDAAGALLNVLSTVDTTRRSARIAAETCLLSAAQAQARALREVARLERESLETRRLHLMDLEQAIQEINVRMDLLMYIDRDKRHRSSSSSSSSLSLSSESTRATMGDDDDAGIASALAVLNTYSEGVGFGVGGGTFSGWNDKEEDEEEDQCGNRDYNDNDKSRPPPPPFRHVSATRDDIEEAIDFLFDHAAPTDMDDDELEDSVHFLEQALSRRNHAPSRVLRSAACYTLNTKRSSHAHLTSREQMEGVCRVIAAILDGCCSGGSSTRESGDVSNAKLCIMLAQTFYWVEDDDDEEAEAEAEDGGDTNRRRANSREGRLYVRDDLCDHALWKDEDFWVQALFQCVAESLTQSGVLTSFDSAGGGGGSAVPSPPPPPPGRRGAGAGGGGAAALTASGNFQPVRRKKWYDLTPTERAEAASQVHAVVFAQILALAHSMMEFGCSVGEACSFVRRLSIRHQLPISQRATLLQHLMERAASKSPKPSMTRRGTMNMGSSRRLLEEEAHKKRNRLLRKKKKNLSMVATTKEEEEEKEPENLPLIISTTEPETPVMSSSSSRKKVASSDDTHNAVADAAAEAPATTTTVVGKQETPETPATADSDMPETATTTKVVEIQETLETKTAAATEASFTPLEESALEPSKDAVTSSSSAQKEPESTAETAVVEAGMVEKEETEPEKTSTDATAGETKTLETAKTEGDKDKDKQQDLEETPREDTHEVPAEI